ncbi:MAG: MBL fold metallo-hydrolase [Promethearchaeia archaeon]
MQKSRKRYKINHPSDHIYILQENISSIHPIYKNDPLNLYLLVGENRALLIDTGCRIKSVKPLIQKIIKEKGLIVVNTHGHWDHVLGNYDFKKVHIHKKEAYIISQPFNVSFLKNSPSQLVKAYEGFNFKIPPSEEIKSLKQGDSFDLGDISVEIYHTPGHSPGSICLLTDVGDLFTGDTAYYGEQFLPRRQNFPLILDSLDKISSLCEKNEGVKLYPAHGQYSCDKTLITKLRNGIKNIDNIWNNKKFNSFFHTYELSDENFKYYVPI